MALVLVLTFAFFFLAAFASDFFSSLLGSGGRGGGRVAVDVIGRESTAVFVARASPPFAAPVLAIAEKEDAATLLGADGELAASSLTLHVACKGIERPGTTTAAALAPFHLVFVGDLGSFLLLLLGPGCTFALGLGESPSGRGVVGRTKGLGVGAVSLLVKAATPEGAAAPGLH